MKYADLLQSAEPLETVKQIRESDTLETAKRDVETFVISDRMADQLTNIVIPALRYDGSDRMPAVVGSGALPQALLAWVSGTPAADALAGAEAAWPR